MKSTASISLLLLLVLASCAASNRNQLLSPLAKSMPALAYPRLAQAAGIEGSVTLSLTVEDGKVTGVVPKSGPPMLLSAAEEHASLWKFPKKQTGEYAAIFIFSIEGVANASTNRPKEKQKFTPKNGTLTITSQRPLAVPSSSAAKD